MAFPQSNAHDLILLIHDHRALIVHEGMLFIPVMF